ncbi:hypothetical protein FRB97_003692 [Tulasnella sp. 331]|nr:hypothetical protein FRB97_003692 [Tulasnella sp. 331]
MSTNNVHGWIWPPRRKLTTFLTVYASYRGRQTAPHTVAYLGIPYAEPPIATSRFRKPFSLNTERLSYQAPTNVFDATQYPAFAIQGSTANGCQWDSPDIGGAGSEDCLKLDIYVPSQSAPSDPRPVMVYIHGGGYRFGAPKNQPFDHWVEAHPNIIIVAIYYRLSVLGFLSHPGFETSDIADNNVGLHDQLEGLSWVKANINKFGGDPEQMRRNQNLFHRAIIQSAYRAPVFPVREKEIVFDEFLRYLRCPAQTLHNQVEWLRSKNATELMQAADSFAAQQWKPVVDGSLITDYFSRLVHEGCIIDVPILIGTTTHDGRVASEGTPFPEAFAAEYPGLDESDVRDIKEFYGHHSLDVTYAMGDALNGCSGVFLAERVAQAWLYRFNEPAERGGLVEHSADNYSLFRGVHTGPNATVFFDGLAPAQQAFSEEFMAIFVSFIRSGSPNTHKPTCSPAWPVYRSADRARLVLQANHTEGFVAGQKVQEQNPNSASGCYLEEVSSDEKSRYDFWFSKANKTQN